MTDRIREKLQILADAAKYDVSCSSSGSNRKNKGKGYVKKQRQKIVYEMKTIFHLCFIICLTSKN